VAEFLGTISPEVGDETSHCGFCLANGAAKLRQVEGTMQNECSAEATFSSLSSQPDETLNKAIAAGHQIAMRIIYARPT
jgi:hypothetical protein